MLLSVVVLAASGAAGDAPPSSAASHSPAERILLVYDAPPECPREEAFRAEVRERASGGWEAAPGELARRIDVSVSRSGEHYVAAIAFLNPQGERITRSFSGKACSDVVDGIALVTALAIEARVDEALARSEPDPVVPTPSSAAPSAPPAAPPPPPSAPETLRETHLRLGVAGHIASGTGPASSFGPAAWGVVEWRRSRLGLGFSATFSGEVTANGISAHYRRLSGRLDACPYAWGGTTLALEPCAFFDAGALHGEGVASARLTTTSGGAAPWLVPGLLLRVVAGFGTLVVVAEAAGGPPLVRERFGVVQDGRERTTFRVPALVLEGGLGVGLRL